MQQPEAITRNKPLKNAGNHAAAASSTESSGSSKSHERLLQMFTPVSGDSKSCASVAAFVPERDPFRRVSPGLRSIVSAASSISTSPTKHEAKPEILKDITLPQPSDIRVGDDGRLRSRKKGTPRSKIPQPWM